MLHHTTVYYIRYQITSDKQIDLKKKLTKNIQMAIRHMKIFFTPHVIRQMQIQTAIPYNCTYTAIRIAKTQNTDNAK